MILRVLGAVALAVSLALCLASDHASMAALVWVMSLAGGAFATAMALAWRARWLALLAPWIAGRYRAAMAAPSTSGSSSGRAVRWNATAARCSAS